MKEEIFDKIDRYIRKEMSQSELDFFEKEIAKNPELKAEVELTQQIANNLASRQHKLDKISRWKEKEKHTKRKLYQVVGSVAAVAVLLVGVFVLQERSDDAGVKGVKQYGGEVFRGGSGATDVDALLQTKQYEKALMLIDSLEGDYKKAVYDGISVDLLSEEQLYEKEVNTLALYKLTWQKIQALYGLERIDEVIELLHEFRHKEGEYKQKADSIWNVITGK